MRSILLAIGLMVLPSPALTATQEPAEAAAALLAAACSGCHVNGTRDNGFPALYGRPAEEIRDLLRAFRSGKRDGTVMNRIAKGYSEAEIDLLANYLAAQRPAN